MVVKIKGKYYNAYKYDMLIRAIVKAYDLKNKKYLDKIIEDIKHNIGSDGSFPELVKNKKKTWVVCDDNLTTLKMETYQFLSDFEAGKSSKYIISKGRPKHVETFTTKNKAEDYMKKLARSNYLFLARERSRIAKKIKTLMEQVPGIDKE